MGLLYKDDWEQAKQRYVAWWNGEVIDRCAIGEAPAGLVFAYGSNIGGDHHIPDLLLDELKSIGYHPSSGQTTCPIQGVCILGRGSWFLTEFNGNSGWYEAKAEEDRELLAFVSIVSNYAFANRRGLGTHVLDTSWLVGPHPPSPLCVP